MVANFKVRPGLALAVLLGATSSTAADDRATAVLMWQRKAAAEECLDAAALAAAVEAGLHRTVFVPAAQADLVIKVSLDSPMRDRWSATFDLEDSGRRKLGHRDLTLDSPHCSVMNESLALVVSLMVDVTRASIQPKPYNEPVPPPVVQNHVPRDDWRKRLLFLGSARAGQLPGTARGLSVMGELGPAHGWLAVVGASFWVPAQTHFETSGAKFWLATADASLCATPQWLARPEVSLCTGQQLGWIRSQAFGFDVNRASSTFFYNLTFKLRTTWWATSALGLHLGLGAGIPLVQDDFYATRSDGSTATLLSRPGWVPLADFGLAWRFGQ